MKVGISALSTMLIALSFATAPAVADTWSIEARIIDIIPMDGDGTVSVLSPGTAGAHKVDYLDAIVPEISMSAQLTDRFALALNWHMANIDIEMDVEGAGTFDLGDTDTNSVQLSGLFDVVDVGEGSFRLGLVLNYTVFDNVDITNDAFINGGNVIAAQLDEAFGFGIEARLDTPIGRDGWYFTTNLRWLFGGPDIDIFTDTGGGPQLAAEGGTDFDPLILGVGVGYSY